MKYPYDELNTENLSIFFKKINEEYPIDGIVIKPNEPGFEDKIEPDL